MKQTVMPVFVSVVFSMIGVACSGEGAKEDGGPEDDANMSGDGASDADGDVDSGADGGGDADADADAGHDAGHDAGEEEHCLVHGPGSIVVDRAETISAPDDDVVTVTFLHDEPVFLDVSTDLGELWRDMLQSSITYGTPACCQLDPSSRNVLDLIIPYEGKVVSLVPTDGGVGVEITTSAAIHMLYGGNPCFDDFLAFLETALVDQGWIVMSDDDEDGILDVRDAIPPVK